MRAVEKNTGTGIEAGARIDDATQGQSHLERDKETDTHGIKGTTGTLIGRETMTGTTETNRKSLGSRLLHQCPQYQTQQL
jgi:hypothetical protein